MNNQELNNVDEAKSAPTKQKSKGPPQAPGFKAGGFKATIDTTMFLESDRAGKVFHDFLPYQNFADAFANDTYRDHTEAQSMPLDEPEWGMVVYRMFSAVMSKKLASSLSATHSLEGVKSVQVMARSEFYFPSGVMPVVNSYGKIRDEMGSYDLCGQPFLVLTYCMRAIHANNNNYLGVNQRVNRLNDLFINALSPATFTHAKEWLAGYINSWARVAGSINFRAGVDANTVVTIKIPEMVSGAVGFLALIAGALPPPPPQVVTALNRLAFLETIPNGAVWIAANVTAAYALGIQVVGYGRDEFDVALGNYARDVQSIALGTLRKHYVMAPVKGCSDVGTMGQVIRRDRATIGHAPDKVGNTDIDIGWMMSGSMSYAVMEPERYSVVGKVTTNEAVTKYLFNLRRN